MKCNNEQFIYPGFEVSGVKMKIKHFLFFLLITVSYGAMAQYSLSGVNQNEKGEQFYKVISVGDKINFGNVDASIRWTVANSKERIAANLNGNQINDYSFQQAGEYEVRFLETRKHSDECYHPAFAERMVVKVNPVKMSFDFSKIQFSERIQRGRNYDDLLITVPVTISNKDNAITKLAAPGLLIAGIGVSMKAEPVTESIEIKNGIQLLKYKVSGMVNAETYLMFDFFDFNEQVHTFNLPQIIN